MRELKKTWGEALRYHQWIHFFDKRGKGWAEPEIFIEFEKIIILFEVKLTGGLAGKLQMEWLYKPLLEAIFKKPVRCLLVCKNLTTETPGPFFASSEEFILSGAEFGTWHWLGR